MHLGVPPFDEFDGEIDAEDIEWKMLPAELQAEINAAWDRGVSWFIGKPCIWFDGQTRKCRHYEYRPSVCERFEPGNPICLEDREGIGL